MNTRIGQRLSPIGLALGLALAHGGAGAGVVTGNWDPQFGPSLPDLSYVGTYSFSISDACAGNAAGNVFVNTVTSCGGTIAATANLTLMDTATPDNQTTAGFTLNISGLQVLDGFVIGIYTDLTPYLNDFYGSYYAGNKDYTLQVNGLLPILTSYDRCGASCWNNPVAASTEGYDNFILHLGDDGNSRYGKDAEGNDIGYHVTDVGGVVSITPSAEAVPEPGALSLALAALGALGWARRRRGRS